MRIPRLGLDIDEVLADLHPAWLDVYNLKYQDTMRPEQFTHWDIHTLVKPECGRDIFNLLTPELYDAVQPVPGAALVLEVIRDYGIPLSFVTACGRGNRLASAKLAWLKRHGFYSEGDGFFATRDKTTAPVDVLVDDHVYNVEQFHLSSEGRIGILMERHHNANEQWVGLRVTHVAGLIPLVGWLAGHY